MNDARDPGPESVEKILQTLEDFSLPPTDVARQSRRLRAHIEALRAALRLSTGALELVYAENPVAGLRINLAINRELLGE